MFHNFQPKSSVRISVRNYEMVVIFFFFNPNICSFVSLSSSAPPESEAKENSLSKLFNRYYSISIREHVKKNCKISGSVP